MRSLLLLLLLVPTTVAEEWVGKKCMPRAEATFMKGDREIEQSTIALPLSVNAVEGEWLDIGPARVKKSDVVALENAAAYYTLYLLLHPGTSWAYHHRGITRHASDKLDEAIKDYTKAIHIDPLDSASYNARGVAMHEKGDFAAALKDFDEAIRLEPTIGFFFRNRGETRESGGEIAGALEDYERAIRLDPADLNAYNSCAWILATSKDACYRNPEKAVADATKACELSKWEDPACLDTLAAAYAAVGQFKNAVEWQEKAISLAPQADKANYESRLRLYREGKPFRE